MPFWQGVRGVDGNFGGSGLHPQKCKNSPEFNAVKDAIARTNEPLAVDLQVLVDSSMAEFADLYKKQKQEIEQKRKQQEHEQKRGHSNDHGHGRGWGR
ncbi:MAG: hypothetical protein ACRCWB_05210 [Enterovibrio sp.]